MYIMLDDAVPHLDGVVTDAFVEGALKDARDVAPNMQGDLYVTMPEGDIITFYYMGVAPIDEIIERTRPTLYNQDED